jgi:hypothetical protein
VPPSSMDLRTSFLGSAMEVDQAIDRISKAISATNVSNLLLVREDLQNELAINCPIDTPLRNRLTRIPGNGSAHAWYRAQPTIQTEGRFLGTGPANGFFARGGIPTATQVSYQYMSAPYVSLGDIVEVTLFDQMAGRTYTDVKKLQLKMKMINVALMEEWCIINGNSVANPLQFDGLNQIITTNITDLAGGPYTLSAVTTTMRNIATLGGKPQALVHSYREHQKFSELVMSSYYRLFQQGAGALADIPAGVAVTRWVSPFGTVDIIGSRFIQPLSGYTSNFALILDDKSMTEDGNAVGMVDLMPISAIDLALLQTAYRTLVAEFTVMMVTIEAFQGKIINIGP